MLLQYFLRQPCSRIYSFFGRAVEAGHYLQPIFVEEPPHSRSGRAHALEALSLIAAHNRCASGVRAALPAHPFPRLTLTSGMSQFGPASGSHGDSGPHHYCGLKVRSVRFSASLESLL